MATLNIQGARKAGWSDEKIQEYLKQRPDVKPSEPISQPKQPLHVGEFSTGIDVAMRAGSKQPIKEKSFFSRLVDNTVPALKEFGGTVVDMGVGVAKGVGSTVAGATELVGSGLQAVSNKLTGQNEQLKRPEFIKKATTPVGDAQKIGFGAEQLAEYFIPGGAVTKGVKAVQAAKSLQKAPKIVKQLAGLTTRGAGEAIGATGVTAAQRGELGKEALTVGSIAGATPFVAPIVTAPLKGIRGILGEILVKSDPKQLARDVSRGFDVGRAVTENLRPVVTRAGVAKQAQKKIGTLSKELNQEIGKAAKEGKGALKSTQVVDNMAEKIRKAEPDLFTGLGIKERGRITDRINDKVAGFLADNPELLSLPQQQASKKALGAKIGKRLESKVLQAGEAVLEGIRKTLQTNIETNVPGAKELNKMLAPLIQGVSRIENKGRRRGLLYDLLVGSAYSVGNNPLEDPAGFGKAFLTGIAIRRGLASPAGASTGAWGIRQLEKAIEKLPAPIAGRLIPEEQKEQR